MNNRLLQAVIFIHLFFVIPAFSQTVTPTPPAADDKDVVKISTTLIQVDATVTDKKGNIIKDLKPEDFEVYENGKKQNITNFSFVSTISENPPAETNKTSKSENKSNIPLPPVKLKPEQVRHTYAIVVDDLGLSFGSIVFVQDALKKFVNKQMQDGDLVAILRVGAGLGALQSFTADKRQLMAAISKIRWNGMSRTGVDSYDAMSQSLIDSIGNAATAAQTAERERENAMNKEFDLRTSIERQSNVANGTLGALNYIIRGMRDLPGRKSILFFSEGFQTIDYSSTLPHSTNALEGMRSVAESATRASIVIYTFDPRGVTVPAMAEARDDTGPSSMGVSVGFNQDAFQRDWAIRDSKESLKYLAEETGGLGYVYLNNMNNGIQKVIDDQKGYYLIGYQPDEETFDAKKNKFNKLTVKLTRPDLKVRYRSGFFGITDEKLKPENLTPGQQLNAALVSPFGATGVNLDLYSLFYNTEKNKNFIRSLIRINAKDLTFTQEANGKHKTNVQIVAMTFGDNGVPIDQTAKTYEFQFDEKTYQKVLSDGLIHDFLLLVKKPGAYQFRIALRDAESGKIGSASQFIEVPDVNKKYLTLSNLLLKNYPLAEWKKISTGQNNNSESSNVFLDTTSRQFKHGTVLNYTYVIYNAKTDSLQKTQLQVQTRLFREGKMILEGNPVPLNISGQKDMQRIEISDAVTLGTDLQAGDYILQIIISDNLAKGKKQITTQSVDFEIVN